jgi:hypothetical protein
MIVIMTELKIVHDKDGYNLPIEEGTVLCPRDIMFKGKTCVSCVHHKGVFETLDGRIVKCG